MKLKTTNWLTILFVAVILLIDLNREANAQIITTITGSDVRGFGGDGGLAKDATISLDGFYLGLGPARPVVWGQFMAIDDSDNIYIPDISNHRIRKINSKTCVITTIAGSSATSSSGDGGPATSAGIFYVYGIAVDHSGNIFFTEMGTNTVRKITASTGIITTIAGNGGYGNSLSGVPATSSSLINPSDIVVDKSGNVYFSETGGYKVKKIDATTGYIYTVVNSTGYDDFAGDGGPAINANTMSPTGLAIDDAGNLYLGDQADFRVRKIDMSTGIITTVAGNGAGVNGGPIGTYTGDNGPATSAGLSGMLGITVDHSGNIYIADRVNNVIRKVTASTGIITTIAGTGTGSGQGFNKGVFSGDGGSPTSAELNTPTDVALDSHGNLYILDLDNNRIRKISASNDFSFIKSSPPAVCTGQSVSYTDSSSFSPSTWQWSFPGGVPASSTLSNPTVTYNTPGSYDVILYANNSCINAGDTLKKYITVSNGTPVNATASPASICTGQSSTLSATGSASYTWAPSTGLSSTTGASVNASPGVTSTYTVTAAGGCATTSQVIVTVGGDTAGIITAVRDTICQGTSGNLILTGNSGNAIQWQSSGTQGNFANDNIKDTTHYKTPPLSQTTYYRVVVGSGNCTDTSNSFRLFVPPALVATFIYSESAAATLTFNSDSSSGTIVTYHWDFGDGSASTDKNPTHTFAKTDTTYYVCLTLYDGSNCSYTYCKYASITTGVSTIAGNNGWTIYPTPFTNKIIIDGKEMNKTINIVELYDVLGRVMLNKTIAEKSINPLLLDVSVLANGVYFLHIKTSQNDYVQKVIKQ